MFRSDAVAHARDSVLAAQSDFCISRLNQIGLVESGLADKNTTE